MLLLRPRLILHLEGLSLVVGSVYLYFKGDYSWLLAVVLILAPDLSFAAYLAGPRIGAAGYNLLHNSVLPIALGMVGVAADSNGAEAVALIWLAHIGIDRLLGYGLKYPEAFKETHLQRV